MDKIIILKNTKGGIIADTVQMTNPSDTLSIGLGIDVTGNAVLEIPDKTYQVETPGKDGFDYFLGITTIIGVIITVGFTLLSIKKLFKKDEHKEAQINKLTGIAEEIKSQNEILKEGNDLMEQQVSAIRNLVLNQGSSESSEAQIQVLELERRKHKLSIRPQIKIDPLRAVRSGTGNIQIPFVNHGEAAMDLVVGLNTIDDSKLRVMPNSFPELLKNDLFTVTLKNNDNLITHGLPYEFNITFRDIDGNKYSVKVRGTGINVGINPMIELEGNNAEL